MAKKKGLFGKLALIGTIAGATAAVYAKRKEIRALLQDAAGRFLPGEEPEAERWEENDETDIVIDCTSAAKAPEKETEEASAD